jgi:hypothetical protein
MTTDATIQERLERPTEATVTTKPVKPVAPSTRRRARTLSDEEVFVLENEDDTKVQTRQAAAGGVTITHETAGRMLLWKPMESGSYTPRTVSKSSISQNLRLGWKPRCPECGTNHEDSPYPPGDPNACPEREPIAWTRCPVATCRKRLFDNLGRAQDVTDNTDAEDGEAFVALEGTDQSTPEQRLHHAFLMHMWHRHEREAQLRNLPALSPGLMPQQMPSPERPV